MIDNQTKAPAWAQWKAQDANGLWNWFRNKPARNEHEGVWGFGLSTYEFNPTGEKGPADNWRETLMPVNQDAQQDAARLDAQLEEAMSAINPSHYRSGKIECIDALESATVGKSGAEAVCTANVIKYLWRYEQKNGLQDIRKARWYLDRLIQTIEDGIE